MARLSPRIPRFLPILLLAAFAGAAWVPAAEHAAHRVVFGDGRHFDVVSVREENGVAYLTLEGGHVVGVTASRIVRIVDAPPPPPVSVPDPPPAEPPAPGRVIPDADPPVADRSAPPRGSRRSAGRTEDIERIIREASARYGIEVDLLAAVIAVESGFNVHAVSPKGAQGLMQLMPGTARELAVTDPFDPRQNIFAGARYLKQLLDENDNQYWRALAAYNAGAGRVARYDGIPPYRETINYIRKVIDIYASAGSGRGAVR